MSKTEQIDALCKAVWEMANQAPRDLGGEQRDFYLPRMTAAMVAVGVLFPAQMSRVVMEDEDDGDEDNED